MDGNIKFIVRLSVAEREKVDGLVSRGKAGAEKRKRAHILLKADQSLERPAWSDSPTAAALNVSVSTIQRLRQAYVAQGWEAALERKHPSARHYQFDGAQEAKRATIACSPPPKGQANRT